MATPNLPKSILKKPSAPSPQPKSKEDRDRETALYHAALIQHRKDVELEVLLNTETLMELPLETGPQLSASKPALSDVTLFKTLLKPFQPSDYDCLIQERNINEHCGYTLCPRPRVKETGMGNGKYRIIGKTGKAKDFRVVEKEELEKWCSEECARRALFIRVQLSEWPAWERDVTNVKIQLMEETKTDEERRQEALEEELRGLEIGKAEGKKDLALERGDRDARSAANGMVDVRILEKEVSRPATAPSFDQDDLGGRLATMHLSLDGHTPSFGSQRQKDEEEFEEMKRRYNEDDDDDDDNMDWDI